jgi:hypothetical protein
MCQRTKGGSWREATAFRFFSKSFAVFFLFFASLSIADGKGAETAPEEEAPQDGIFLCSDFLQKGLKAHGGGLSAFKLLMLRLSDPDARNPVTWFQAQISKTIQRALRTRIDRSEILERGLAPQENYFWIQQLYLKELNEHLLDIGGTQYYLQALDASLYSILEKHPNYGRMVHVNYKDRVLVTSLEVSEFEAKVLIPARASAAKYVKFLNKESGDSVDWKSFIDRSTTWNHGRSLEESFMNLRLAKLGMKEEDWRRELLDLRKSILARTFKKAFPEVLRQFRRLENQNDTLVNWFQMSFGRFVGPEILKDLRRYLDLLSVGDMLPVADVLTAAERTHFNQLENMVSDDVNQAMEQFALIRRFLPEAWTLHRNHFLQHSVGAQIIISTDLKGLGHRALMDRHEWAGRGALATDLPTVYANTTAFLHDRNTAFENALRKIVDEPGSIIKYTIGDDGLWALPHLTSEKLEELRQVLHSMSSDFYFHIEIVAPKSAPPTHDAGAEILAAALAQPNDDPDLPARTAHAINNAWKALFESKNGARQRDFQAAMNELEALSLEGERVVDEPAAPTVVTVE